MERKRLWLALILVSYSFSPMAAAPARMVFPGRHWQETKPEAQGVDSTKLKAAVTYLENNSGPDGVRE
ncbi:MAG: hypothetical protein ACYSUX_09040, partial [Planctomycetota bacterium]